MSEIESKKLSSEHKELLHKEYGKFKDLIDKYAKDKPEISYNFFDGWHLCAYWKGENALVEFLCYRSGSELNAYKDDDSEWMEIDEGRSLSYIERNGEREKVPNEITEDNIKQAFAWLYEGKCEVVIL